MFNCIIRTETYKYTLYFNQSINLTIKYKKIMLLYFIHLLLSQKIEELKIYQIS